MNIFLEGLTPTEIGKESAMQRHEPRWIWLEFALDWNDIGSLFQVRVRERDLIIECWLVKQSLSFQMWMEFRNDCERRIR